MKNFTEQKILVLSLVHHILFEYYLVYDYESLVINLNKERIKIVDVMYISDYLIDVTYNTDEKFRINIESKLAIKYYAPLKNKSLLAKLKSMDNSIVWELEGGEIKITLDDIIKLQK